MIKQQRWAAIIDLCRQNTSVSVTELVQLLRVSEATVRRDLQQMEDLNIDVYKRQGFFCVHPTWVITRR